MLLDVPRSASRRVALLAEPPGGDTHPEIAAAVRRAGDALADAGYDVVEAEPPLYEQALDVWGRFLFTDIRAQEAILRAVMGPDATRFLDLIGALYPEQDAAGLVATLAERRTIARAWAQFELEHPLILSPIWTQPPFPHGWDVASEEQAHATMRLMRPVMPANLLGLPAAAVPRREGRRTARRRAGDGRPLPGAGVPRGRRGDRVRARRGRGDRPRAGGRRRQLDRTYVRATVAGQATKE